TYSTGAVFGGTAGGDVGGLVGENDSTITASFWDTTISGALPGVGTGTTAGATGDDTATLQQQNTYTAVGWDFTTIWNITEGTTYPFFRALTQTISFGALPDHSIGEASFTVSATASSGLPVSFTASGSCSVADSTVTLTGTGSCTITAHQPGNSTYAPA